MPAIWRSIIVLLVLVIAVLQVIHITLLSRLEARKSSSHQNRRERGVDAGRDYRDLEAQEDRALMLRTVQQSSVLDSSGEYHIISFLMRADGLGSRNHIRQDVCLITQCTVNHLHYLESITSRWHGPVSITVFTLPHKIPVIVEAILHLRRCFPAIRYNTSFHLVYPLNSPLHNTPAPSVSLLDSCDSLLKRLHKLNIVENYAHGVAYPVNLLRNVARRNALTEFVFTIDIDLLPSDLLHEDFLNFAKENRLFIESYKDDKTVYVVPAFEVKGGVEVPRDKTSLLQLVELMDARPFYFELCWKCQKHTDYETWQHEPQREHLAVLFEGVWSDPWEPFYIGRNTAPFYDERFRQYGFNRISQVCELHVAGYKFSVLNNAFVVHDGWKTASSFHKDKDTDQERNRVLFRQFKNELKEKYPSSSRRCY